MYERLRCRDEAANHQLQPPFLSHLNSFHKGMFKLNAKFDADLLLYSLSFIKNSLSCIKNVLTFLIQLPHGTHAHSMTSTALSDSYSEVVIVHTRAFQSTLLGCQVTSMLYKPFSLY